MFLRGEQALGMFCFGFGFLRKCSQFWLFREVDLIQMKKSVTFKIQYKHVNSQQRHLQNIYFKMCQLESAPSAHAVESLNKYKYLWSLPF